MGCRMQSGDWRNAERRTAQKRREGHPRQARTPRGFTLIELLVVLTIVALMLTIVTPRTIDYLERSRETTLKASLREMRHAIDQFEADRGRLPSSIDELVIRRYLRDVPIDPFTDRRDSWLALTAAEADALRSEQLVASADDETPPPDRPGVADVRSGAQGDSRDGTPYSSW
jgi:general secretion pathway protein G